MAVADGKGFGRYLDGQGTDDVAFFVLYHKPLLPCQDEALLRKLTHSGDANLFKEAGR